MKRREKRRRTLGCPREGGGVVPVPGKAPEEEEHVEKAAMRSVSERHGQAPVHVALWAGTRSHCPSRSRTLAQCGTGKSHPRAVAPCPEFPPACLQKPHRPVSAAPLPPATGHWQGAHPICGAQRCRLTRCPHWLWGKAGLLGELASPVTLQSSQVPHGADTLHHAGSGECPFSLSSASFRR